MAWWQRQRGQYVYLFYRLGGKIVSLPRSTTKHLDSLNDASVDIWFDDWKQKNQSTANRKGSIIKHVDRYCKFLRDIGRAPKTVWEHRHSLTEYVVPYFLHRHPILENPNQWPSRSLKFSDYVMDVRKKSNHTCRKAVAALKYFYRFLTEEGIVYTGMPLRLRCPSRPQNHTPLKTTILPADVLSFAYTNEPVFSMMAVVGFFFSLRTFELMALRPIDFIAGTEAQSLECCRVMVKYGHFNRLAVRVHRQRRADGTFNEPKRASFGYVACFNQLAAEWLVVRLNELDPHQLIFPRLPDTHIAKWRRYGIPGITLKDLRRASLYHLGHYEGVELIALKGHARHKFATTTELYLRRPMEQKIHEGWLDLGS